MATAAIAIAAFFCGRAAILGPAAERGGAAVWAALVAYLVPTNPVRQLLPMLVGAGPAVLILAALGLRKSARRHGRAWLRRRLWLLAAWSVPGYLFWFAIVGNNARHTPLLPLMLIWLGLAGWENDRRRGLIFACALALAFDWLAIPPGWNVTLYPSGNVPASARLLHRREADLARFAARLLAAPSAACYFGSYTTPYVAWDWIEQDDRRAPEQARLIPLPGEMATQIVLSARSALLFNTYDLAERWRARRRCPGAASLEWDAAGRHRWFMGREVLADRWSPLALLARVWYRRIQFAGQK